MYQTKPDDFISMTKKNFKFYKYPAKRQRLKHNLHRYKVEIHIMGQLAYRIYGATRMEADKRANEITAYLKLLQRKAKIDANRRD